MGSEQADALPSVDSIEPGVFADLRKLVIWQCEAGDPPRRIGVKRPLTDALEACGHLLDALGLTPLQAVARLDDVLPREREGLSGVGLRLYAVRAMLGFLDTVPDNDTLILGAANVRLGDAPCSPSTVATKGYTFTDHLVARKAYVMSIFGVSDPSALKLSAPSTAELARALALVLGLAAGDDGRYAAHQSGRRLLSEQLAVRLNENPPHYPPHFTTTQLAAALTVSRATPASDRSDEGGSTLYGDQTSSGGVPLEAVLAEHRRVVVLGNPGGGKSTALTAEIVKRNRAFAPALIVRLPDLAALSAERTSPRSARAAAALLYEVAAETYALPESPATNRLIDDLVDDPAALIALDGLDEVHADDREWIDGLIRLLAEVLGTVVVSSRLAGYVPPPGIWHAVTVDHLPSTSARTFFEDWFEDAQAPGLTRALSTLTTPGLARMATIPVFLGIVAVVAEEEDVSVSEPELYERYIALLLERIWKEPRGRRSDSLELLGLVRGAEQLAWEMATGLSGRTDGTRWIEVAEQGDLLLQLGPDDQTTASLLLEREGLFAPHGRSRSRLHQRYRFIHRTIHEHLVGAYLAAMQRSDPARWRSTLTVVFQGPRHWHRPLSTMVALLDEEGQRQTLEHLEAIRSAGDPGDVLGSLLSVIARHLPTGATVRRIVCHLELERGNWDAASLLDTDLWLEAWSNALAISDLGPANIPHDVESLPGDDDLIRGIVESQRDAPHRDPGLYMRLLERLRQFDSDAAFVLAVAAVAEDPSTYSLPSPFEPWPSGGAIDDVLTTLASLPVDLRVRILGEMMEAGVPIPEGGRVAISADEVRAAEAWGDRRRIDGTTPTSAELAPIVRGDYGEDLAFFTVQTWLHSFNRTDLRPGAQLALALDRLDIAHDALTDEEAAPDRGEDPSAAAAMLEDLSHATLDAAGLQWHVEAMTVCLENPTRVTVDDRLRVYRSVMTAAEEFEQVDAPRTMKEATLTELGVAVTSLLLHDTTEVVAELLSTDPSDWVRPGSPEALVIMFLDLMESSGVLTLDEAVAVTVWAAADGYAALPNFELAQPFYMGEHWIDPEALLSGVHSVSPRAVSLDGNRDVLASHLARIGQLAGWRDRLLGNGGS